MQMLDFCSMKKYLFAIIIFILFSLEFRSSNLLKDISNERAVVTESLKLSGNHSQEVTSSDIFYRSTIRQYAILIGSELNHDNLLKNSLVKGDYLSAIKIALEKYQQGDSTYLDVALILISECSANRSFSERLLYEQKNYIQENMTEKEFKRIDSYINSELSRNSRIIQSCEIIEQHLSQNDFVLMYLKGKSVIREELDRITPVNKNTIKINNQKPDAADMFFMVVSEGDEETILQKYSEYYRLLRAGEIGYDVFLPCVKNKDCIRIVGENRYKNLLESGALSGNKDFIEGMIFHTQVLTEKYKWLSYLDKLNEKGCFANYLSNLINIHRELNSVIANIYPEEQNAMDLQVNNMLMNNASLLCTGGL